MKQIRKGVFETNSSSTHSLIILNEEDMKKWKNREMFFDMYSEKFKPMSEFDVDTEGYITYERYIMLANGFGSGRIEYEFAREGTSTSGEILTAISLYRSY